MTRWFAPLLVGSLVGLPALAPIGGAIGEWPREWGRVAGLSGTTLALAGLAAGIALVPGVVWGVGLAHAGRLGWTLAAAGAAVPLSVQAVAWQAAGGGLLDWAGRTPGEPMAWRPWREGLLPAAFVHGMAGVPAVAVLVGLMLRSVDLGLLEAALLEGGWRQAGRRVLGPRLLLGATAGATWVALQAATEIPVTDAMQVRTAAEEVYTQFATQAGGPSAALLVAPFAVLAWMVLALAAWWLGPALARPGAGSGPLPTLPLSLRWATTGLSLCVVSGSLGVPLLALAARAAGSGGFGFALTSAARTEGGALLGSLATALVGGSLTALLAVWAAWDARLRPGRVTGWVAFALLIAVTPGPVVGLGLQSVIGGLIECESRLVGRGMLDEWLYSGPSPVPAVWACVVRFFPVAFAVCLPRAWVIPTGLLEQTRLDGLGHWATWSRVTVPTLSGAWVAAALGVAALALGEVSASRLVDPPGRAGFAVRLFAQMHYGAESMVAAMALLQVAALAGVAALVVAPKR